MSHFFQVEIRVTMDSFSFRYLEMRKNDAGVENYVLHHIPQFQLYEKVDASKTELVFSKLSVKVISSDHLH